MFQLFQLLFTVSALHTLVSNTDQYAAEKDNEKRDLWHRVSVTYCHVAFVINLWFGQETSQITGEPLICASCHSLAV